MSLQVIDTTAKKDSLPAVGSSMDPGLPCGFLQRTTDIHWSLVAERITDIYMVFLDLLNVVLISKFSTASKDTEVRSVFLCFQIYS